MKKSLQWLLNIIRKYFIIYINHLLRQFLQLIFHTCLCGKEIQFAYVIEKYSSCRQVECCKFWQILRLIKYLLCPYLWVWSNSFCCCYGQVQTEVYVFYFLIAWTITEIIRYSFYFFSLLGGVPYTLKWCRFVCLDNFYSYFWGIFLFSLLW